MKAPLPENEIARLEALRRYHLLDTAPEQAYDDITRLASFICGAPIALMTLIDESRQWFKSKVGIDSTETPRNQAFCAHTILGDGLMIVENAMDDLRFSDNPLVTGEPDIRFYAGAPLKDAQGRGFGSLCVIDSRPRTLSPMQEQALSTLARMVVSQMELRRSSADLAAAAENIRRLSGLLPICSYCKGVRDEEGDWQRVEAYLLSHAQTEVTHGICPVCAREHFPGIDLSEPQIPPASGGGSR